MPRSWVRSKFKVTKCNQNPIDSHPFRSILISSTIPDSTLKIQCSRSKSGPNILSIHIPFIPCQSTLPFLRYGYFQIWFLTSKVKVMGEVKVQGYCLHSQLNILSIHPFCSMSISPPIYEKGLFQNLTLKFLWSRSHIHKGPTSYRLPSLSFHVNQPSHYKIRPLKYKVEIMGEVKVQGHIVGPRSSRL